MHFIEHRTIKEESGDFVANLRAQTNQESRETEVHFGKHKKQSEESRETLVRPSKHKTVERELED